MEQPNTQTTSNTAKDPRGETVTVACKLPHGIVLRAFRMVEKSETTPQGSRQVNVAEQIMGEFTVMGNSYPEGGAPRGRMEGTFALTPGCPKELWERWLKDNKDSPMVTNGLIFAHAKDSSAIAESREKDRERSGFERLDPNRLPRGMEKAKLASA